MSDPIVQWERSLVTRIAAGDDAALAIAFDQYGAHVYGTAVRRAGRACAAEVTGDVFADLWDHPDRFDPSVAGLRTHLVLTARRRATGGHRAVPAEERTTVCVPIVPLPNLDEAAAALIAGVTVRDAFARLPAHQREAISLASADSLTFREIAIRTGTSESAATSRVRLGLRRLARTLQLPDQVRRA